MRRLAIVYPAVARRSPAMTTPSANRIATIVVPWGASSRAPPPAAGVVSSPFGSWCGATRRRSSAKDGPGSRCGGNAGNEGSGIGAGAYRLASFRLRQRLAVAGAQVVGGGLEQLRRLLEQAQRVVAPDAEQPAHVAGAVVVVDVQRQVA